MHHSVLFAFWVSSIAHLATFYLIDMQKDRQHELQRKVDQQQETIGTLQQAINQTKDGGI